MSEQNIKNFMWGALGIAAIVSSGSLWSYAHSYGSSIEPSSYRSFAVTGEGKVVSVPDVATFSFSVVTQGSKDLIALQSENSTKMNKAISFLKEQGIPEADIKTQQYSLEPRYQYYPCTESSSVCRPADIVGYTITQSAEVKIHDFTKIGSGFSGVVQNGANTVSQLSFTIDDSTSLESQARAKAIAQAEEKARATAAAAGFSLGRLLSIDNSSYPVPMYDSAVRGMGLMKAESSVAPLIQPGSQEIRSNVTLRFEIK